MSKKAKEFYKENYKELKQFLFPSKWTFEFAESYHQSRVNAISDDFKKILEDESDCKGIYLTKGTIRGSEALDAFEIWINKLLKQ